MRFAVTFTTPQVSNREYIENYIKCSKKQMGANLGVLITETFDWQNPVHEDISNYRSEVEVFPLGKWMNFQSELSALIDKERNPVLHRKVGELLKKLEQYHGEANT